MAGDEKDKEKTHLERESGAQQSCGFCNSKRNAAVREDEEW